MATLQINEWIWHFDPSSGEWPSQGRVLRPAEGGGYFCDVGDFNIVVPREHLFRRPSEWPQLRAAIAKSEAAEDRARAALQAIAEAEPAWVTGAYNTEDACDTCVELIATARKGLGEDVDA